MGNRIKKTFSADEERAGVNQTLEGFSKSWNVDQWKKYLSSLESPLIEKQVEVDHFDRLAARQSESIFTFAQESSSPEMFAKLQNAIFTLTPQQRAVITHLFYKSKSHRQAARDLLISQSRVRDLRNQAIKKLKSELQRGALTLPLVDKLKKEKKDV